MTPGNPIVFDEVRIDGGENYDNSTGLYTVPVNGFYEFHVQIFMNNFEFMDRAFYIEVDGTFITDSAHDISDGTFTDISSTATVIVNLLQGQQVSVAPFNLVSVRGAYPDPGRQDGFLFYWSFNYSYLRFLYQLLF